ncbi:hypothetical protein DCO58_07750 [Helicobacter saguini]|uniref:Uncharacterized protein n=1 Tax=Helicobacter saguini TaxID=1548018 RepID=A0A347W4N7_9HELI|nr:hypothetical protein [Helicobacter saguini]MWV61774.1 hypothetical protein [Helicobacter saguini]MWV67551.1 hypothetical protein [Helicobacter saguini]MWV69902.1 hypothetical protein [Helicobacter saguini]MWV72881.1 hypothetical protein [Helicobacter saguini]TLD93235.1 hypothetical protein LS64_008965 [Helicobacter saguini]
MLLANENTESSNKDSIKDSKENIESKSQDSNTSKQNAKSNKENKDSKDNIESNEKDSNNIESTTQDSIDKDKSEKELKQQEKEQKKKEKQLQKDIKKAKKQKPLNILPDNNPYLIDYTTLDRKYYPFIQRSGKFYDSDIKETIRKVDIAERKSGVFVGILWGANINVNTASLLANLDSINPLNNPYITNTNYLLFGLKIGYQSYMGQVLPLNTLGYQIFVDIASSFGQGAVFYTTLNIGLLYDFFETNGGKFGATFFINFGFGSANITGFSNNNIYEFAGKIDIGLGVRINGKNKINFSLISSVGGMQSYFVSGIPSIGYEYVF